MERVGQYLIVRQLSIRAYGSVYLARRQEDTDQQGKYLIKVFNPTGAVAEEVAISPQVQGALERAALQQKVAQGGAAHWAPIFEHGICDEGAYYVSLFYPSSIRRLIEGRVHLQPASLRLIALGIVDGLMELKAAANRAHANLSPQTVLLELSGNQQLSAVLLAEPGAEADAAKAGEPGDIKAIGELLYQIIMSRSKLDAMILPLGISDEWKYLGPAASQSWLNLINYLLDPEATQQRSLDVVRQKIAAMEAGKAGPPKALLLAAAAAVLLAGLAGGGWYLVHRPTSKPDVPQADVAGKYPAAEKLYDKYWPDDRLKQLLESSRASAIPELSTLRQRLEAIRAIRAPRDASDTQAKLKDLNDAIQAARANVPAKLLSVTDNIPSQWGDLGRRLKDTAAAASSDEIDISAMVAAANWLSVLGEYDWKGKYSALAAHVEEFRNCPPLPYFKELLDDLDKAASQANEYQKLGGLRASMDNYLALGETLSRARNNSEVKARLSKAGAVVEEVRTEIEKDPAGRVQSIGRVLRTWEARVMVIPKPTGVAEISESHRKELADRTKEYGNLKSWTLDTSDTEMQQRTQDTEKRLGQLNAMSDSDSEEFKSLDLEIRGRLRGLEDRVKEGEARRQRFRQIFEDTEKSFDSQLKKIEAEIPKAEQAGTTNGPAFKATLAQRRAEMDQIKRAFKTLGDADIDSQKTKLDDGLAALFDQIVADVADKDPVSPPALPKFTGKEMPTALAGQWDDFSAKVLGRTKAGAKITKDQQERLNSAKQSIEDFAKVAAELETKCNAMSGLNMDGGAEIKAAAGAIPKWAVDKGTELIKGAFKIEGNAKKLTISSDKLLEKQSEWNNAARRWLECWREIERELNAGTGSTEKVTLSNPQLADLTGAITLVNLKEKADAAEKAMGIPAAAGDPLKPLRDRLATLADFEAKVAPSDASLRAAWLEIVLKALKADRLEMALAAAKKLAVDGAPRTVNEFKDLDAARKMMPAPVKSRLDRQLDATVASALSTFARQGLQKADTVEVTVNALADLKSSLGLVAVVNAADPVIAASLAQYVQNGFGDSGNVEKTATALGDLQATLGLSPGAFAEDAAIDAALSKYTRTGLGSAATVQKTAAVLVIVKKTLGWPAAAFATDPAIMKAIVDYALGGLADPARIEKTAGVLADLKATLEWSANAFKDDTSIKAALATYLEKGLGDATKVEETARVLVALKVPLGLDANAFKNNPAIIDAIVTFARKELKDGAKAEDTATKLVSLKTGLELPADVYKDARFKAVFSGFVRNGLTDVANIQKTAADVEILKTKLTLTEDVFKDDSTIKAISDFARNGLKEPARVEETAAALDILKKTLGLAKDLYEKDPTIQAALAEFGQKGLRNATTVETTVVSMEKVEKILGFPLAVDNKDPFIRSNLALYRAKMAKLKDTDNATAVGLAQQLLKQDVGLSEEAHKNLIAALREQMAEWTKYQSQVGAKGGPNEAHFEPNAKLSTPDLKVFDKKVGNKVRSLAFGRIMISGEPVFLCTTETPMWVVDALASDGAKLVDLLGISGPVSKAQPVPRPWYTEDITEFHIRSGWLPKYDNGFSPYPDALRDPADPEKLATKSANLTEDGDQPLTYIPPKAAEAIAKSMGCRLATSAEWRAAAAEQTNLPNLRDRSWEQVASYLQAARRDREEIFPKPCLLAAFSYAASKAIVAWNGEDLAKAVDATGLKPKWKLPGGGAYDDQHPFFWPANFEVDGTADGKPHFRDLIGNVGEYVMDTDGEIHIAGGSALSDPAAGLGVQNDVAVKDYADVGLRLAFTPIKEGKEPDVARSVKKLLDEAKYVTAKTP